MLRSQINGFKHKDRESLFESWERYKDIMRLCPYHGIEQWIIIHTFYNGLLFNTKLTLDDVVDSSLMDKPYQDAHQLIENMAQNHYQWGGERTPVEKSQMRGSMYEVNNIYQINAKVDALMQNIESLTVTPTAIVVVVTPNCELCGDPENNTLECQLLAGIPSNQLNYSQGNPYSNTYNLTWRNHLPPLWVIKRHLLLLKHPKSII